MKRAQKRENERRETAKKAHNKKSRQQPIKCRAIFQSIRFKFQFRHNLIWFSWWKLLSLFLSLFQWRFSDEFSPCSYYFGVFFASYVAAATRSNQKCAKRFFCWLFYRLCDIILFHYNTFYGYNANIFFVSGFGIDGSRSEKAENLYKHEYFHITRWSYLIERVIYNFRYNSDLDIVGVALVGIFQCFFHYSFFLRQRWRCTLRRAPQRFEIKFERSTATGKTADKQKWNFLLRSNERESWTTKQFYSGKWQHCRNEAVCFHLRAWQKRRSGRNKKQRKWLRNALANIKTNRLYHLNVLAPPFHIPFIFFRCLFVERTQLPVIFVAY